jgi:phage-related protein
MMPKDNVTPIIDYADVEERLDYDDQRLDNLAADTRLILNIRLPEIRADIAELKEDNRAIAEQTQGGINKLGFMLIGLAGLILWQLFFK